ncbi:Leucine Rich repeats (2 copies) [Planctomycetes bacterium CA13]|uniref:Leucine Rich repeats (2 copies) n=1 Tax=Novipirellula herctigrandis TaxID=2527986 RepID=A0A5C5Z8U4_9BACT|nr:Leucine Rich repeats (2 copies) [Planctomycetes bacterium CA13]
MRQPRLLMTLAVVPLLLLAGCPATPPPASPEDKRDDTLEDTAVLNATTTLSHEQLDAIRESIESSAGKLTCDADGVPVEIDLAVGRGSASAEAFHAALECRGVKKLRIRAGGIPVDSLARLGEMKSLTDLTLNDAKLDDELLLKFAVELPQLRRLTIRNSPSLTDSGIASAIQSLTLTHLTLLELAIGHSTLHEAAKLRDLASLDIRLCHHVTAESLAPLVDSLSIKELKLGGQLINDEAIRAITSIPTLKILAIADSAIGADALRSLTEESTLARRIEAFTVERCPNIDDEALVQLEKFPNLRRLTITDVPVTGKFLASLPTLDQLTLLSLNLTFLDDTAFETISKCKELERLEIAQSFLTEDAIAEIAKLPRLKTLNVSDCGLDDAMLQPLRNSASIEKLITGENAF